MDISKSVRIGIAISGHKNAKQWCEANGMARSTISELNKHDPKMSTIKKCADACGVPVSEFIKWGE